MPRYGGDWVNTTWAGITVRIMRDSPTHTLDFVASSNTCKYYTDHHEVDEDLRTIAIAHAGRYQDMAAGQMVRDLYYVSDTISDKVASEKKNKLLSHSSCSKLTLLRSIPYVIHRI